MLNVLIHVLGRVSECFELGSRWNELQFSMGMEVRDPNNHIFQSGAREDLFRLCQTDLSQSSSGLGPSFAAPKATLSLALLNHDFTA